MWKKGKKKEEPKVEDISKIEEISKIEDNKPIKKKWSEKSTSEKIFTILRGIKIAIGKIIRFFAKTFLVLFVLLFVAGCVLAGYVGMQVWPYVEEYKAVAYEKFDDIGPNTFSYLGDTVIYDKDGKVISEINIGNYKYTDIEDISKTIQEGYIATEDKRFKVHNGIDYKALTRASVALLKNHGEITQGGSTITQQVIKNGLLTQERSFKRKLIEFFLAPEFEKQYTKQEIMEFYVNTNFYGNNCYGIETASQYYFGKPNTELSLAQSAMLIGVSNNGTLYNPKKNMEGVKNRQKVVLNAMLEDGYISEEEYKIALEEPLEFAYDREVRTKENYLTSYAIHSAVLNLMEQDGFKFKYLFENEEEYDKYKENYSNVYGDLAEKVRGGGYKIYTSLDQEKQAKLQEILDKNMKKYNQKEEDGRYSLQGAAVLVNNDTGYVEAIIGGRGTDDEFNRGFLAKRQPGSSIKPIIAYTPAFNTGLYYPSLIMEDKPDSKDKYYPDNYNFKYLGPIPLREALGRSINTIAYQLVRDIGANNVLPYLEKMRFDTLSYMDNFNTAIALGGFTYGVRVVDMAKAYSTLINHGEYIDNNCVTKIEFQNTGVIFEEDSNSVFVYEPDAAYMGVDVCRGSFEAPYGLARGKKIPNQITMGKTGTTNQAKDIWFCGGTEYYSMSVWVGYDNPKPTHMSSSGVPAQIWKDSMIYLHKDLEKREFERPESVVDLPVDYKGKISKYNTGKTDLFSQTLLDKAEEERLALIESKKIAIDNERISTINSKLNELKNYIIKNVDAVSYLNRQFGSIEKSINEVYQEDKRIELFSSFEDVKAYFAGDIARMERFIEREKVEELRLKEKNKEKEIVKSLNEFNSYAVSTLEDIDNVEVIYGSNADKIEKLSDNEKRNFYHSKLTEIYANKQILLAPYIKEREEQRLKEIEELEKNIETNLTTLESLIEYYNGVESLFDSCETLIKSAEEKGIETEKISEYLDRLRVKKEEIYNLKPIELPEEIENSENIENPEEIENSDDIESSENLENNGGLEEVESTDSTKNPENKEESEESEKSENTDENLEETGV